MTIIRHINNDDENTRVRCVRPRKRPPTSAEQRAKCVGRELAAPCINFALSIVSLRLCGNPHIRKSEN
jgi:hypothetical protein